MRKVIATTKIFTFISFTIANYIFFASGLIVARVFGHNYEQWKNRCLKFWGKYSMKCLGIEIEIEGTPPDPPFFLVSNHLSYIDIPVYYYALKTTFVAMSEIKNWPVVGLMARSLGIIFIDRTNKLDVPRVNSIISKKISKDQGIVLFPEGRTSPGDEILRFRAGLLQHPVDENIDVHYAVIRYETGAEDPPARDSVCWWQDTSLMQHLLNLASNRSITARVSFGQKSIKHKDRKILAEELHRKAKKIFVPLRRSG